MKQSIGYTLSLNIAITFIIIVFAFIAMALSYYRAFKVSKVITATIEKNEGYTLAAEGEILKNLSIIGYNMTKVTCAPTRNGCTRLDKTEPLMTNGTSHYNGDRGYCVYYCNDGDGYYRYKTTTNMLLNIPIVNSLGYVPVEINTNKMYEYNISREKISSNKICKLVGGTSQKVGSKYSCTLDEERLFYVLENKSNSGSISLIMDRNFTDETVPSTMDWCDQNGDNPEDNACNHDNLDPLVAHIQTQFGSNVTVSLPTKAQIEGAYTGSMPTWLYGNLNSNSTPYGYWTASPYDDYFGAAWDVYYTGGISSGLVYNDHSDGVRPVITISKKSLN